jgi:hypothetical protein
MSLYCSDFRLNDELMMMMMVMETSLAGRRPSDWLTQGYSEEMEPPYRRGSAEQSWRYAGLGCD